MILAFSATFGLATAIAAALLYGLLALARKRLPTAAASAVLLAACLLHALTLAEGLFGDPPALWLCTGDFYDRVVGGACLCD